MIIDKTIDVDLTDSSDYYFCVYSDDLKIILYSPESEPNIGGLYIGTRHNAFRTRVFDEMEEEIRRLELIY